MAKPVLTTVQHVMGFLPDRTFTSSVADAVSAQLKAASAQIRDMILPTTVGLDSLGIPEIMMGDRATEFLQQGAMESDLIPDSVIFGGNAHKLSADCAKSAGDTNTAYLVVQPAEEIGILYLTVRHPADMGLTASGDPVTFRLYGVPTSDPMELLRTFEIFPLPGGSTTLNVPPLFSPFPRYRLEVSTAAAESVYVSRVDLAFPDTEHMHLHGIVPESLSEAAARFAAILFYRAGRDGLGKGTDETGRSYAGSAVPADIRAMLSPYMPSNVMFL